MFAKFSGSSAFVGTFRRRVNISQNQYLFYLFINYTHGGVTVQDAVEAYVTVCSSWWNVLMGFSDLPAFRGVHTGSVIPDSTANAFQLIRSQPSQYVVASFAGTKYVLTPRDMLTVPRLRDVKVGDVLAFDQIHEIGSREYTIRGNPAIPSDKVKVEATVVEHTKGKMEFIFKKKRRKGYRKTIQHKQPYTRLRIGNIQIPVS